MGFDLFIGDKGFSSWSLRGWLLFEKFGINVQTHMLGLYSGTLKQDMKKLAPARFVPTVRTPEGWVIGESTTIAETLAERFPDAGIWPQDAEARVFARWLVAEIHAGFATLRGDCPMQLFKQVDGFEISPDLQADIDRLEVMLGHAFDHFSDANQGPWLFGNYSAADAFYAPVAARIAGYNLPVSTRLAAYVHAHLTDPAFKAWRADGISVSYDPFPYDLGPAPKPWPVAD
ncbi:glutathione S-transferase [Pacificibacter maritimus]|uniref:Glutathione S-transferase n=1 Tax=Pacificibacter maritimus TaxID=762213 RepID=A0A3N4UQM3_9RHOB|nr:glutathione S-transferase [Pacificibacter maritimus]RPE67267.1 glutathione S-transferase [Pacificibacter maritimus]